ncbi:secretin N-terminal domain-containing protein [Thalassobius sp. S69A]|uniref:secretin N-terminal domain-containing protein n=1 Tax=unclassified Thalassovita TaxID=2619711 RepID=UPI000C0DDB89|nr:type II secretion system protein GspD [Paracoccaceae bacterium]MBT24877.1 type II secretion system protein GspD [Paracoccaceae bacterium]
MTYRSAIRPFLAVMGLILTFGIGPVSFFAPVGAQAQVVVNLRDADLKAFVEIVSEATGRRFVLDPEIRGRVTVLAPDEMTEAELYEVFLTVLELNRLTLIEGTGADRIVRMSVARELSSGPDSQGGAGAYESRVIQLKHAPVNEVVEVVRPLLPAEAVMTPVPGTSLIILSDRGQNFRRIEALIRRLDQPRDEPIQMIRLRNANATEVSQVITAMDILPEGAALSVDRRSNALVVSGPDALREKIRVLASRLDTQQNNVASTAISLNYAEAASMADVVLRALNNEGEQTQGTIRIVPEPQTNTLLITAPQDRMQDILQMVRYLDQRPKQVLVEAVIFEMSVTGFSDLSVQFAGILNNAVIGGAQFSLQGRPSLTNLVSSVLNGQSLDVGAGGVLAGVPDQGDRGVAGLLTAIASTQSTRLLSTPSIMTLNNKEAEIVVAQNVPFVTGSYSTVSESAVENPFQTIERQDVGLTLNVTPQINADRTVKMEIKQEVSNLTSSESSAGGEITSKRALSTTVLVRDGNVIMLGGLLENGAGSTKQRVPGLSKLPLVGGLFRAKNASKNQRVLLVLLRPQVVNSEAEARKLSRQIAREAKQAAAAIQPLDDKTFPRTSGGGLPFDGADLNQPFDAGFIDDVAQSRNFPPLPSRLRFEGR